MVDLPTPKYTHLTSHDFDNVYEPAEDTFLMMDALQNDMAILNKKIPTIALEVGPGAGLLITFLAKNLKCGTLCLASDINSHAACCTSKTASENNVQVEVTTDNLLASFTKRLKKNVDVIIFNPPYVVTPSSEIGSNDLSASWAGGIDGREVIDKFLKVAVDLLSDGGYLYLLVLEQNKPDEIMKLMRTKYKMTGKVILQRRSGPEYLKIIRFQFIHVT